MRAFTISVGIFLLLFCSSSFAAIDNAGLLDTVLSRYAASAATWANEIQTRATWLFWLLVPISMVWTFGFMALRRAEIGEFFGEFIRFTIFTGFFWWLLTNGPNFANSIILSMRQIGGNATGSGHALTPSGIVDIGFVIFDRVLTESSFWSPVDSAVGIIIGLIILVILALIGVNMLLLLISGWILAYAGIFYLGFGGSRWTSDIAINYFKTVLGIAMQLFTMVLLVGIGQDILNDYYTNMSAGVEFGEMAVLLIVAVVLLVLVNKLPALIAGVITGASVGGMGIGSFGAGAALGAAGALGAAAAVGGAMTAAAAANASGGAQAIMAAISRAQSNVESGSDILASLGGSAGSSRAQDSSSGSNQTPFSSAAGFSSADGATSLGGATQVASGGDMTAETSGWQGSSTRAGSPAGVSEATSDGVGERSSSSVAAASQATGAGDVSAAPIETPKGRGLGGMVATAGRVAADASANLARGVGDVAKQKTVEKLDAFKDRVSQTIGGQIATAIRERDTTPNFSGDSIGGEKSVDAAAEVAAFRDKSGSENPNT